MTFEGYSNAFGPVALIVLAVIASAYVLIPRLRNKSGMRPISFFLRVGTLLILCLALARPYSETVHEESDATVLLDISDSMDEARAQRLLAKAQELRSGAGQFDLIPFAGEPAATALPLGASATFGRLKEAWGKLNIGATNLESGLNSLLAHRPGSVVIISDGQQTKGNALLSTAPLAAAGFKLFPLIPNDADRGPNQVFTISQLHAPLVAPAKKSVDIRTTLRNTSASTQTGLLEIKHDTKVVFSQTVSVNGGEELLVVAQSDPSSEGIKEITATLSPESKSLGQSSESIFLSGAPREKVLLLSGTTEDAKFLQEVLEGQSYQLKALLGESKIATLPDFSEFSAVVLNNIPIEQLPRSAPPMLEQYVRDGGGLIMLGGNKSFGLGGYKDSPVEKALPVSLLPPETVKKRLNVAVELVLDKSRSMADGEKLDFAKEAARESIRNLKDDDLVGVIGFDASPFVVVELSQVGPAREKAIERVGRLFPAGRTNLIPAIDEARRSLARANAGRKHIIILTDGKLPDEGPFYLELVKEMRLMGITVSTVLLGGDVDPGLLRTMADEGGGAYYQTADPHSLPKIFLADIKVGSGEKTLKEESEYLVRSGAGELVSTSIRNFPPVRGYVQTKPKEGGNVELVAYGFDKADPLLASWGYGKGKAIAFTSDANGRWSNSWVGWSRFSTFWSELVDWARKRNDIDESLRFDLRYSVEHGALALDLSVYSDKIPGSVQGILKLPSGETRQLDLSTVSPGHYQTLVPDVGAGHYEFRASVDRAKLTPVAFNLPGTLFGEHKGEGFDTQLLYNLAVATGGKVNPEAQDLRSQVYVERQKQDLTPLFVLVSLLLVLLEIVERELGLRWRKQVRRLGRQSQPANLSRVSPKPLS